MAETKPQETQQELFPALGAEPKEPQRFPSIAKAQKPILISTTMEQLILAGIVLILVACFVFFLGMVRGRSIGTPDASRAVTAAAARPAAAPTAAAPLRQAGRPVAATLDAVRLSDARNALRQTAGAVPAAVPPQSSASKPYTIQLASYVKKDLAEREAAALRKNGFLATIKKSGNYYYVCVGEYGSIEEAKKDLRLFASRYKDRFLRRR